MAARAELQAVLDCDDKPFVKAMDNSVRAANKAGTRIEKAFSFSGVMAKAGGALTGVLAGGAVLSFTKDVINMGGELQDAADKLNLNTDALQGLGFAFSQSGASQETFEKGMVKLNQTIFEAMNGNDQLLATFGRMGVSFNDLKTKSPDEVLLLIADAAKDAKNPTQALHDIMELLGKSGSKMAAGLKQGSEGIKSLADQASKLTTEEIKALDDAGDQLAKTWLRVKVTMAKALTVPEGERYKLMGIQARPDFVPGQKVQNAPMFPGDVGFQEPETPSAAKAEHAREIFANFAEDMEEQAKKEKKDAEEKAKLISDDLKRRGDLAMEIQEIEAKTFDIQREAARAQMDSSQLLVSLEKERATWVSRAVSWERDRFQLHMKDAALARQEAARLAAMISSLKTNGPKTAESSMFDARGESMREQMMKESGLGIYSKRSRTSNWVFNQGVGLQSSGGLRTGGLSSSGLSGGGGDAYNKIRRGDAARAREAAKGAAGAIQTVDAVVAANTAELVRIWGGGGKRK